MVRSPRGLAALAKAGRPVWTGVIALGLVGVLTIGSSVHAQDAAAAAKNPYMFSGDGAMTLNFIKADKTADFETAMGTIKTKMSGSDKPDIKAAGESMKLFKVDGPPSADTGFTYLTVIDLASKATSYSPTWVLFESGLFERADADMIYNKLKDTYIKIVPWPMGKIGG